MPITIETIDGDVYHLEDTWKKVDSEQFNEKWVECPTLIDKDGNLWVDETVLNQSNPQGIHFEYLGV